MRIACTQHIALLIALPNTTRSLFPMEPSPDTAIQPRVYTKAELLTLRDSPLVKKPDGLPAIEQWMDTPQERPAERKARVPNLRGDDNAGTPENGPQRPLFPTRHASRVSEDQILLGPSKAVFSSSGRNLRATDPVEKNDKLPLAPAPDEPYRPAYRDRFNPDKEGDRDRSGLLVPRRGAPREDGEGWQSVKPRKSFGQEDGDRWQRGTDRDRDRHHRDGDPDHPPRRNGPGRGKLDLPWGREENGHTAGDSDQPRPARHQAQGWRERERKDDRDWTRGARLPDQRVEEDPEWLDEPVKDESKQMKTAADFERWKEQMRAGKNAAVPAAEKTEPVPEPEPPVKKVAPIKNLNLTIGLENNFGLAGLGAVDKSKKSDAEDALNAQPSKSTVAAKSRFATLWANKPTEAPAEDPMPAPASPQANANGTTEDQEGFKRILEMLGTTSIATSIAASNAQLGVSKPHPKRHLGIATHCLLHLYNLVLLHSTPSSLISLRALVYSLVLLFIKHPNSLDPSTWAYNKHSQLHIMSRFCLIFHCTTPLRSSITCKLFLFNLLNLLFMHHNNLFLPNLLYLLIMHHNNHFLTNLLYLLIMHHNNLSLFNLCYLLIMHPNNLFLFNLLYLIMHHNNLFPFNLLYVLVMHHNNLTPRNSSTPSPMFPDPSRLNTLAGIICLCIPLPNTLAVITEIILISLSTPTTNTLAYLMEITLIPLSTPTTNTLADLAEITPIPLATQPINSLIAREASNLVLLIHHAPDGFGQGPQGQVPFDHTDADPRRHEREADMRRMDAISRNGQSSTPATLRALFSPPPQNQPRPTSGRDSEFLLNLLQQTRTPTQQQNQMPRPPPEEFNYFPDQKPQPKQPQRMPSAQPQMTHRPPPGFFDEYRSPHTEQMPEMPDLARRVSQRQQPPQAGPQFFEDPAIMAGLQRRPTNEQLPRLQMNMGIPQQQHPSQHQNGPDLAAFQHANAGNMGNMHNVFQQVQHQQQQPPQYEQWMQTQRKGSMPPTPQDRIPPPPGFGNSNMNGPGMRGNAPPGFPPQHNQGPMSMGNTPLGHPGGPGGPPGRGMPPGMFAMPQGPQSAGPHGPPGYFGPPSAGPGGPPPGFPPGAQNGFPPDFERMLMQQQRQQQQQQGPRPQGGFMVGDGNGRGYGM
ncbi:hypothetical protein K402DRAFT_464667 [Aulographum hederae CBS 113979]|uniref:Uncharacterized protein n=1 Tax=Aulographum hederae CBS 113979 TaxID=1176131 RepID=A0A6G1GW38_9PEZI|nr:hypothetical protein K402DRAFT_464667 [Aulographum hederae CBS 113979]